MQPIIKIENLSKVYRLGVVGTGTLSHDLKRWYYQVRGREDPYLKIAEVNARSTNSESDYVWALKDINLEVMPGEVLGIIGKNGAGKSTLLKILSKVTGPTTGSIHYNGRIGALLEVGTGFHQELTGRENIFLNGAILGMTKAEIRGKLDEIIYFSGVERYIDTPVKRYSSGMMVRLGFAVAAHLEPEILIVDEVLAVGDVEFQKKCLAKMQDVSKKGRTVLFVSHNMSSILGLCNRGILLDRGQMLNIGETEIIINKYLSLGNELKGEITDKSKVASNKKLKLRKARLLDEDKLVNNEFDIRKKVFLEIFFEIYIPGRGYNIAFELTHLQYGTVFASGFLDFDVENRKSKFWERGKYKVTIELPVDFLRGGDYYITITSAIPRIEVLDLFPYELSFRLLDTNSPTAKSREGRRGVILPVIDWQLN